MRTMTSPGTGHPPAIALPPSDSSPRAGARLLGRAHSRAVAAGPHPVSWFLDDECEGPARQPCLSRTWRCETARARQRRPRSGYLLTRPACKSNAMGEIEARCRQCIGVWVLAASSTHLQPTQSTQSTQQVDEPTCLQSEAKSTTRFCRIIRQHATFHIPRTNSLAWQPWSSLPRQFLPRRQQPRRKGQHVVKIKIKINKNTQSYRVAQS